MSGFILILIISKQLIDLIELEVARIGTVIHLLENKILKSENIKLNDNAKERVEY